MAVEIPCDNGVLVRCLSKVRGVVVIAWGVVDVAYLVFFPTEPNFSFLDICSLGVVGLGGMNVSRYAVPNIRDDPLAVVTFTFIRGETSDVEVGAFVLSFLEEGDMDVLIVKKFC